MKYSEYFSVMITVTILVMAGYVQAEDKSPLYGSGVISGGISVSTSYLSGPSASVEPYRWYWGMENQFPLSFELVVGSEDISDGSDFTSIDRALSTWSNVSGSSISASSSAYDGDWGALNDDNEIGWIESGWESDYGYSPTVIALAHTWYYTDTLEQIETDIMVNGDNFSWYTGTDDSGFEQFYVEHILLHELGHAFSLSDLYDAEDIDRTMYGYGGYRQEDTILHRGDELALAYAYAIPEPSMIFMFLFGIFSMLGFRKKQ
ncbi:MAG: PEP-CTERM sorting domain-containing protein [Candidatus Heimdallarchaeota archaeon]|nr:PEP-CTERM sorting domain-containing protein [Candidatus Heimdallarchaeota archaeon]